MKRSIVIVAVVLALLVPGAAWYLWGPAQVPDGQPALVALTPGNFAELKKEFNDNATKVRVVVLLSPT
jgi:hypothetical protein